MDDEVYSEILFLRERLVVYGLWLGVFAVGLRIGICFWNLFCGLYLGFTECMAVANQHLTCAKASVGKTVSHLR